MKANLQWNGDYNFKGQVGTGDEIHEFVMDAPGRAGGDGVSMTPMEAVLGAAGTCAAMDVTMILRQARQNLKDCKVELTCERADTQPAVFTKIHMHFDIYGEDISNKQIEKALKLTFEKYCTVSIMLINAGIEVTSDYTFHQA